MEALADSPARATLERAHLADAHHQICTALTVFRSNVELVRIKLRDPSLPPETAPIREHLDEIDGAIERLRHVAHELKRWHDEAPRPQADADERGYFP